jgi:SAM-dependent methyltransferase
MLDVACGKGRHALELANKGFEVTGIDLSSSSIHEALKFKQSNLQFFEHDMRLPFWINYFDYAFNFFTSFGYFKTKREDNNAIRSMAQSLKNKGILVLDFLNVSYTENNMIHLDKKEVDQVEFTITKWYDDHFFYKKIQIEDNKLQKNYSFTETVAKYTLKDFTSMFETNNLKIVDFYGDYQFGKYDQKESPRLIMFAEKI